MLSTKHLAHVEAQPSCSTARQGMGICIPGHWQPPGLRGLHPLFLTKKCGCWFLRNMGWTCPFWATVIYLLFVTASDSHRGGCSYWHQLLTKCMPNISGFTCGALFNARILKSFPDGQTSALVCRSTGWAPLWQSPGEFHRRRRSPLREQVCGFVSARLGMSVEQLFSLPIQNSGWSLMLDRNQ